jgi:hypothetical protein
MQRGSMPENGYLISVRTPEHGRAALRRLGLKSRPLQHAIGAQLHVDSGDISVPTFDPITYSTP